MKTSFYFILWIVIYPLLGLIGNEWIDRNSFIVALFAVWGLSWYLNRAMPETISYERKCRYAEIMNEVYGADTEAFRRRLSRNSIVEFVSALYFGVTFVVMLILVITTGANDWVALVIFAFLAFGTIVKASRLQKAAWSMRRNPTPEECARISQTVFGMNYAAYYEARQNGRATLPPPPPHYKAFQVFSLVAAIVCALLGAFFVISSLIWIMGSGRFGVISTSVITLLYGSLAVYYGTIDSISTLNYLLHHRNTA